MNQIKGPPSGAACPATTWKPRDPQNGTLRGAPVSSKTGAPVRPGLLEAVPHQCPAKSASLRRVAAEGRRERARKDGHIAKTGQFRDYPRPDPDGGLGPDVLNQPTARNSLI